VQVYVNNVLVKSVQEDDHLSDLQETFDTLRLYNMKLNPNKCVFRVTTGKFLGWYPKGVLRSTRKRYRP